MVARLRRPGELAPAITVVFRRVYNQLSLERLLVGLRTPNCEQNRCLLKALWCFGAFCAVAWLKDRRYSGAWDMLWWDRCFSLWMKSVSRMQSACCLLAVARRRAEAEEGPHLGHSASSTVPWGSRGKTCTTTSIAVAFRSLQRPAFND